MLESTLQLGFVEVLHLFKIHKNQEMYFQLL